MRTIKVRRLYNMGQYANIEFTDELEVPNGFENNYDLIKKLTYLQILRTEIAINQYYKMLSENQEKSPAEIIALLEDERLNIVKDLPKEFNH